MRALWALAIAAASVSMARPARAETNPPLTYAAPDGCPTQAELVAALAQRGEHLSSAEAVAKGELSLSVSIEQDSESSATFRGSFQTRHGEQASTVRDVHGATCAEVFDALAVMSAIALRADREPDAPAAPAAPAASGEASHASAVSATSTKSAVDPDRVQTHGEVFGSPFVSRKQVKVEAGMLTFQRVRSLSLSGGAAFGVLPGEVVPRYELSLTHAAFTSTPDGNSYQVGPVIRSRISAFGPATHDSNSTSSTLFGLAAGVGTCVAPLYDTHGFVTLFCGDLGFGVMQVNTNDRAGKAVQRKTQGFGSVGFGFDGQYNFSSTFHLGLKLGLDLLTSPVSAERANGDQLWHSMSFGRSSSFSGYGVTGYAELGFGIHF